MSLSRREDFDVYSIINKGLLTASRLQNLTGIIYRIVLEADGSCSTPAEVKKKIQEAIPLFEYAETDIKSVSGSLHGIWDCIIRHETTAGQREVAK